ncbi:MAG: carboxypeptidase-like regulatory domain-containing protein [Cytophagaceae bacterium]|nr:carboxypeptidase-like regulatory domain-containing protein [Cytophagaceae bacterium]
MAFKYFLSLGIILFILKAEAQSYTISGYIKDAKSGEAVIGASIFISNTKSGTTANTYGFYSISFKATDTSGLYFHL